MIPIKNKGSGKKKSLRVHWIHGIKKKYMIFMKLYEINDSVVQFHISKTVWVC